MEFESKPPAKRAVVNASQLCGDCIPQEDLPPADRIVFPKDVVEINKNDESIYIVGTKVGKVTRIGGLEDNLKLKIDGMDNLTDLEKLELYDNQIECVENISSLSKLRILDLSFNSIKDMVLLSQWCPLLEELYMAQNRLKKIEGLDGLVHLKVLDLGANRIRVIEGLESCINLKSLWLGKNKIELIQGLDTLNQLRQLDIQNNRLTTLGEGLRDLTSLEELYLACNAIENVVGLPVGAPLSTVDLSANRISSVEGIDQHPSLTEVWMTGSLLASYEELAPLTRLPQLSCLYLEHSPVAKDFEYRMRLTRSIPSLEQLDATLVSRR